jgi:hypothetical protein
MPGKKRERVDADKDVVDNFGRRVFRDPIPHFYARQNTEPKCRAHLTVLSEKIKFEWSKGTLRKILKELGFRWKKCFTKRLILIARAQIVYWRCRYLQSQISGRQGNVLPGRKGERLVLRV